MAARGQSASGRSWLIITAVLGAALAAAASGQSLAPAQLQARTHAENAQAQTALDARAAYGRLPLQFEYNAGQNDPLVRYSARGRGYTLFLTADEAVLALRAAGAAESDQALPAAGKEAADTLLRLSFVGASGAEAISASAEQATHVNYYRGNDPVNWRTNVPMFGEVQYGNLYPGIDLVFHGNQTQLEYDFVVQPGADPKQIALHVEGAEQIAIDASGDLLLHAGGQQIVMRKPAMYQDAFGVRQAIAGAFMQADAQTVRFAIGEYDASQRLVIDPILSYSTYLGGSGGAIGDYGVGIAVDAAGEAFVTGQTGSSDFPTHNPYQSVNHGYAYDAFVAKLTSDGSALVYATYLGGSNDDTPAGIGLDSAGNAYIAGSTFSTDFPTTTAVIQTKPGGINGGSNIHDGFVSKFTPTGGLAYSTFLGGVNDDTISGIAVDPSGNAYVTGMTGSAGSPDPSKNFPGITLLPGTSGNGGPFVAKLNPSGSALSYSTLLGSLSANPHAIAIDNAGDAYITGDTQNDLLLVNAVQPAYGGGANDAFVLKLNPAGNAILYGTYLGGSGPDAGNAIKVDSASNIFVAGETTSLDYPTSSGSAQPHLASSQDGFVTKINAAGGIAYSTYFGGSSSDWLKAIAVDAAGNAYIGGFTFSPDLPVRNAVQPYFAGCSFCADAFEAKINPAGSMIVDSTYLGGSAYEQSYGIAVDNASLPNVYITGWTSSVDFPTHNPLQAHLVHSQGFGGNAFVTKIDQTALADLAINLIPQGEAIAGRQRQYVVYIANNGTNVTPDGYFAETLAPGEVFASIGLPPPACVTPAAGAGGSIQCNLGQIRNSYNGGNIAFAIIVTETAAPGAMVTDTATISSTLLDPNLSNNSSTAGSTVRAPSVDVSVHLSGSPNPVQTGQQLQYTLNIDNNGPDVADNVVVSDTLPAGTVFSSITTSQGSCSAPAAGGAGTVVCSLDSLDVPSGGDLPSKAPGGKPSPTPAPKGKAPAAATPAARAPTPTATPAKKAGPGAAKPTPAAADGTGKPKLPGVSSASITIIVSVTAPAGTTIANQASVTSDAPDPYPANNLASTSNDVSAPQCHSVQDGNWGAAATWDCAGGPGSGTDVTINNLVTLNVGGASRDLTLGYSGVLTVPADNPLSVGGNWTDNGTFAAISGTVTFTRSGITTLSKTSALTETFCNLDISAVTVLDTTGNILGFAGAPCAGASVNAGGSIQNEPPVQTISGNGSSASFYDAFDQVTVVITQQGSTDLGDVAVVVDEGIAPPGNVCTISSPPSSKPSRAPAGVKAARAPRAPAGAGNTVPAGAIVQRYFDITVSGASPSATVQLFYSDAESNGADNSTNGNHVPMALYHCNTAKATWERIDGTYGFDSVLGLNYVIAHGLSAFSPYAIGTAGAPTAVTIERFSARPEFAADVPLAAGAPFAVLLLMGVAGVVARRRNRKERGDARR